MRVKTYVSKSSEKSPHSFTLSAISVLFIPRSSWQLECHTVLALKFAAVVSFFFYSGVVFLNGHCFSLGNHCYSVLGLGQ